MDGAPCGMRRSGPPRPAARVVHHPRYEEAHTVAVPGGGRPAAKIAARDARRDAEKSALIRVVHDDVDTQRAQTPFLDEFVARGVNVHFEAMSNAQFWIGVDFDDGNQSGPSTAARSTRTPRVTPSPEQDSP